MLDLTNIYANKTYDVKLFDGTEIHLKRPTQAIQENIILLQQYQNQQDKAAEVMKAMMDVFVRILNRNADNRLFTLEEIEEDYDISIAMLVIQDYFAFWSKEVTDNVNFQ
jgi:hypothetical protein